MGVGWRFVFNLTGREMLSSGIASLFHPSCLCFLPHSPLPALSFLLPLACPCPVWTEPHPLLFPSFPLPLPSHPHFPLPQILVVCMGWGWAGIALPPHRSGLGQWWGLSPSEPVSQHCLRDWSLPSAPALGAEPGSSRSSLLCSQPEKRLHAGRGWGLKLFVSDLGEPEESEPLSLFLPRTLELPGP